MLDILRTGGGVYRDGVVRFVVVLLVVVLLVVVVNAEEKKNLSNYQLEKSFYFSNPSGAFGKYE